MSQPNTLVRSDTIPAEDPSWQNPKPPMGPAPIPPRNEPVVYIAEPTLHQGHNADEPEFPRPCLRMSDSEYFISGDACMEMNPGMSSMSQGAEQFMESKSYVSTMPSDLIPTLTGCLLDTSCT
jgi:hypothetical protein